MQNISKFEIRRLLGKGSQSSVYLAYDPILQREVALKILLASKSDSQQFDVLLHEARTSSKLRHRNIVPIFEAGEHQGQIYLVFEYVDGRTLDLLIKQDGPIAAQRAAELMLKILDAVAHAHEAGIIHRDLKPTNILIGQDGQPRVMDFGIATPASPSSGLEPDFTGTPAYMSPEYIARRIVTPQYDVFSAGLMLYEMVVGHRAIRGDSAFQAMHQISNVPLVFPPAAVELVDGGLHQIIARATAKDADLRFKRVQEMHEALDAYLRPRIDTPQASGDGQQSTLDFLLRRMKVKTDFPAMSAAITTIQRMTSADKGDVNKLSNAILKDFALTNKILRLVNSAYYPMRSGAGINTVSRAIVMMGFNAVSSIATSLILFEHLKDKKHADMLRDEFLVANMSAIISAEISAKLRFEDVEQIYVCAVFHNLGRLLAQYYFREEAETIAKIASHDRCSDDAAAVRVLGISYQDLGIGIAKSWEFPESIINSMRRLPPGKVVRPRTPDERLRLLSVMSCELGAVFEASDGSQRAGAIRGIMQRFGDSIPLGEKDIAEVLEQSGKGLNDLAAALNIDMRKTRIGGRIARPAAVQAAVAAIETGPGSALLAASRIAAVQAPPETAAPAGLPGVSTDEAASGNGLAILAAGIQDISQALIEDVALNDLLRIVAETIFRAIDVKRVLMCLRDVRDGQMRARFGYGDAVDAALGQFHFSLNGTDLFNLILRKDVDVLIRDATVEKVQRNLPEWYQRNFAAPAFIVLPISIKNQPAAMIYADHDQVNAIRVSAEELALLRTLRNQAVMAIKQAQ
jgi:serine/threonine protein kinase